MLKSAFAIGQLKPWRIDGPCRITQFGRHRLGLRVISSLAFERPANVEAMLKAGATFVSDAAWLTPTRPDEIERYWTENYPDIATVAEDIAIMEQEGYSPVGHFTLPEEGWTENYYVPMAREIDRFAAAHPSDPAVDGLLDSLRHEIATYERYKEYYGYVFFIGASGLTDR